VERSAYHFECYPFQNGRFKFSQCYHRFNEGGPTEHGDNSHAGESENLGKKQRLLSPYGQLVIANKIFGFTPDYTLDMSAQLLNTMIMEYYYMNNKNQGEDEKGEFEWIEYETVTGEKKRVKKYLNNNKI